MCWKDVYHFYMQFYVSVHMLSHPSEGPSGVHNQLGWSVSGQGKTCWFKSCPCRSSEGARDLFYIKAKIVEGLAWKSDHCPSDFDLLSPCYSQLGLCHSLNDTIDSLLISVKPWKNKKIVLTIWPSSCFTNRGKESTMSTLASLPLVHHKWGECTLIQSIQIRT